MVGRGARLSSYRAWRRDICGSQNLGLSEPSHRTFIGGPAASQLHKRGDMVFDETPHPNGLLDLAGSCPPTPRVEHEIPALEITAADGVEGGKTSAEEVTLTVFKSDGSIRSHMKDKKRSMATENSAKDSSSATHSHHHHHHHHRSKHASKAPKAQIGLHEPFKAADQRSDPSSPQPVADPKPILVPLLSTDRGENARKLTLKVPHPPCLFSRSLTLGRLRRSYLR